MSALPSCDSLRCYTALIPTDIGFRGLCEAQATGYCADSYAANKAVDSAEIFTAKLKLSIPGSITFKPGNSHLEMPYTIHPALSSKATHTVFLRRQSNFDEKYQALPNSRRAGLFIAAAFNIYGRRLLRPYHAVVSFPLIWPASREDQ